MLHSVHGRCSSAVARRRAPGRHHITFRQRPCPPVRVRVADAPPTEALVDVLTRAGKAPGSVPPSELLRAVVGIERSKTPLQPDYYQTLSRPDKRWRLVYTVASKDVQAFLKGQRAGAGGYFPIPAAQKFDTDDTFENGVFLGPVASLTFKGPALTKGKQLSFDVHTMYLGVGPWRVGIPLKKDGKPLSEVAPADVKKLPFFLYAYIDENIIVARGRSGGLALWAAADAKWQANAGVLQVYK